jgi:hypothetical protein
VLRELQILAAVVVVDFKGHPARMAALAVAA